MTRYYIRMIHSGLLLRKDAAGHDWVDELGPATGFLSYGEAQCEALNLRRAGFVVSAVTQAEALQSVTRLQEAV